MALVLILVIIASLSVAIAGSVKVLTSLNEKHSINRNRVASADGLSKSGGSFLCYKVCDDRKCDLKSKLITYDSNGVSDIKSFDNCKFNIPKGASGFDVYLVGRGGDGGNTSYIFDYTAANSTNVSHASLCLNQKLKLSESLPSRTNCLKPDYAKEILKYFKIKAVLDECMDDIPAASFDDDDFRTDDSNILSLKSDMENIEARKEATFKDKCKDKQNPKKCNNCSNMADGLRFSRPYHWKVTIGYNNRTNKSPILENFLRESGWLNKTFRNITADGIIDVINIYFNNTAYPMTFGIHVPVLVINYGQSGKPGIVSSDHLSNSITGKDGKDYIEIKNNQIADRFGNEQTVFVYYYPSSANKYAEYTLTTKNGADAKSTSTSQNSTINSGELPKNSDDFSLAAQKLGLNNLDAGYTDSDGNPVNATFFGASGASGYLDKDSIDDDIDLCSRTVVKIKNKSTTIKGKNCVDKKTTMGSKGAPGAILINW